MRRRQMLFVIAVALLLAACGSPATTSHTPAPSPTATDTIPTHPQVFSLYAHRPILPHGRADGWDARYIDPGAMVFYNGMFHMFYNGITGYPAPVSVGYATSPDGRTWTKVSKTPVLLSSQVAYAGITIFASSVLVQPDGTWVMYFYTLKTGDAFSDLGTIGRATAPQPTGPWTPDPTPALQPGKSGSWDALSVSGPSVVRTDTGYVMYYRGVATVNDTHGAFGMATSSDGIHWTKYNNSATRATLYAESDPVLLPGVRGAWDAYRMIEPNVIRMENGWVMAYLAAAPIGAVPNRYSAIGYATSSDGVTWHKSGVNPILTTQSFPAWTGIFLANMLYQNGTLYLYFDVGQTEGAAVATNVWMATHQGLLND